MIIPRLFINLIFRLLMIKIIFYNLFDNYIKNIFIHLINKLLNFKKIAFLM